MSNRFRAAVLDGKIPDRPEGPLTPEELKAANPMPLIVANGHEKPNDRWNDRHELVDETVAVRFNQGVHVAGLINLSGGGARISADLGARKWDKLLLILGEGSEGAVECAVRWVRGDEIGLEFAHETQIRCSAQTRDRILRDVIGRTFPDDVTATATPANAIETIDEPPPSAEEAQAEPDHTDANRSQRRHPLIWMADVPFDHSIERVRLRNISETGVLIESDAYFPTGADLLIDMAEAGSHFAKVMWRRGDQYGMEFARPFDLDSLAKARPAVTPQQWAQPRYLRQRNNDAGPWETHWGRQSIEELQQDLGGFLGR